MREFAKGFDMDEQRYREFCAKMDAQEQAWKDEVADIAGAQQALDAYVAQLDARFLPGGVFDTRCIPSGEAFVELVCGGEFHGQMLCRCFSPHVAVRIFVDTVERYIASCPQKYGPSRNQTLYWRIHPMLIICNTGEWKRYDEDEERVVTKNEMVFNVRARLLIL